VPLPREGGRGRALLIVAATLWAGVVILTAAHKSGDLTPELAQSERLLHGLPLYERNPSLGVWWPPLTAVMLVPFALIARANPGVANGAWAALGVACVVWSVRQAGHRPGGWTPALVGLLAVAKPLHNSFEHGQITAVLLALVVAATVALERARDAPAGVWIGLATAVKAFPGLLLPYLALRRRWRALLAGCATAAGLTLAAMLPYGPLGAVRTAWEWFTLNTHATGVGEFRMQKLGRLVYDLGGPSFAVTAAAVALTAVVGWAVWKRRALPGPMDAWYEAGVVTLVAVLISPIGWFYYFGLLFPAWVAVLSRPTGSRWSPRRLGLVAAGLLTSGALSFVPIPTSLSFLGRNHDTWGALLLLGLLVGPPLVPKDAPTPEGPHA